MHDDGMEKRVQSDQRPIEVSTIYELSLSLTYTYEVDLDQIHARAFVLDEEHL